MLRTGRPSSVGGRFPSSHHLRDHRVDDTDKIKLKTLNETKEKRKRSERDVRRRYLARWQLRVHDRATLQRAVLPRIRRLTDLHVAFPSVAQNLAWYVVLLLDGARAPRHVGIRVAVALRRGDWAVDVRVHVGARFLQVLPSTLCDA